MARVLLIDPFHGGSHAAFSTGLASRSRHDVRLETLPASHWKWRMRGAAPLLAERVRDVEADVILTTDMISLAELLALLPRRPPVILYMHENQVVFPAARPDPRDVQLAFTNITSCLAATRVVWNSRYHMDSFLEGVRELLSAMPDHVPRRVPERIASRSLVIAPGVDLEAIDAVDVPRDPGPPIVVWNHRWEHDKRPEDFFEALQRVADRGTPLRVCVLGQSFQSSPPCFEQSRTLLGDRIAHMGWVESRERYIGWMRRSTVSVSTAVQENFGIAAVEAARAGAFPLWPDRLSYPELLPPETRGRHLWSTLDDLVERLDETLRDPPRETPWIGELDRWGWERLRPVYDDLVDDVVS